MRYKRISNILQLVFSILYKTNQSAKRNLLNKQMDISIDILHIFRLLNWRRTIKDL